MTSSTVPRRPSVASTLAPGSMRTSPSSAMTAAYGCKRSASLVMDEQRGSDAGPVPEPFGVLLHQPNTPMAARHSKQPRRPPVVGVQRRTATREVLRPLHVLQPVVGNLECIQPEQRAPDHRLVL